MSSLDWNIVVVGNPVWKLKCGIELTKEQIHCNKFWPIDEKGNHKYHGIVTEEKDLKPGDAVLVSNHVINDGYYEYAIVSNSLKFAENTNHSFALKYGVLNEQFPETKCWLATFCVNSAAFKHFG